MKQIQTVVIAVVVVVMMVGGCKSSSSAPKATTPKISSRKFTVTDYGAVGDGRTLNTEAIAHAIDACVKHGGGEIVVPPGVFITGPIELKSGVALVIEKDATLRASDTFSDYGTALEPSGDPLTDEFRPMVKPIIGAENASNIAIRGGGTIDGAGAKWWERVMAMKAAGASSGKGGVPPGHRPRLILLRDCQRVQIAGITIKDSPNFNIALFRCDDVVAEDLTITAPAKSPNTDGIDPANCRNVIIRRCTIDVGDDNVSFKCVRGSRPLENVLVTDCTFKHGHGASVGSALGSGIRNITVQKTSFEGTTPAIRIKSARDRGAVVENILYKDITMKDVSAAIYINMYYFDAAGQKERAMKHVTDTTPIIRKVRIENVTATNAKSAGEIVGLPEMPVSDVVLKNVNISAQTGFKIRDARNIEREDFHVEAKEGEPITVEGPQVAEKN
jgi:polygalacturonase